MIKRTISGMVGKGSFSHNNRDFIAKNVDESRISENVIFCHENLHQVYQLLFGEALKRYNSRQKRSDRKIADYYKHIQSGHQEKLYHEVIFQIGNGKDTAIGTQEADQAKRILVEFMSEFRVRNPFLYVFSAHIHMDEATPHLHIDFVPYVTGSKRGLDTRVSLKKALAAQGFEGGSRGDTEINQWIYAEKQVLAQVMEHHGMKWVQMDTHNKHLSVLDYKKQEREKEVAQLDIQIEKQNTNLQRLDNEQKSLKMDISQTEKSLETVRKQLNHLQKQESLVHLNADRYDTETKWQLPEPGTLMSARSYKSKIVEPFVAKLKGVIRSIVAQYLRLKGKTNDLESKLASANERLSTLNSSFDRMAEETTTLRREFTNYKRIRHVLGEKQINRLLEQAQTRERGKARD